MSSDLRGISRKVHSHELGFLISAAMLSAGFDCIINCRKVLCYEFHFHRSQEFIQNRGGNCFKMFPFAAEALISQKRKLICYLKNRWELFKRDCKQISRNLFRERQKIAYTLLQSRRDWIFVGILLKLKKNLNFNFEGLRSDLKMFLNRILFKSVLI